MRNNTVELCRKVSAEKINKHKRAPKGEREELCYSLDLEAQQKQEAHLRLLNDAGKLYPQLTTHELRIWQKHNPKRYSRKKEQWKKYNADHIPLTALREIQRAKSLDIFEDFEIWIAADGDPNPIVIGILKELEEQIGEQDAIFLITRWGENKKPFHMIEREVLRAHAMGWEVRSNRPYNKLPKTVNNILNTIIKEHPWSVFARVNQDADMAHCGDKIYQIVASGPSYHQHVSLCGSCRWRENVPCFCNDTQDKVARALS